MNMRGEWIVNAADRKATGSTLRCALAFALLLSPFCLIPDAVASPSVSQAVGVSAEIRDEFGHLLDGHDPGGQGGGAAEVDGDRVEILQAIDGTVHPPAVDGTPHPSNVILSVTRIGQGVTPDLLQSGRFGTVVAPRPSGNSRIFVRVFNAHTPQESSFYGDSQLFTVLSWKNKPFMANILATTVPLDPTDPDGDGLNNSWERSLGSDPGNRDTDSDGMDDGDEFLAGTSSLDASSVLVIVEVKPVGNHARLTWDAVPGKTYRVEYTPDLLDQNPVFSLIAVVTADEDTEELLLEDMLENGHGAFRVMVQ